MARNQLQVQIVLDRLHCYDEGDGWGSAEPYLWTVFFKVDGDTVSLGDDLFLHGTATVVTTPGSHGTLGDTDVDAGDDVAVPSAIGEFLTTLRPIPVPEWVESLGVEDAGGVVGAAVVLMEEDWVSDQGAEAGHAALNHFVQQAIDTLIPTLGVTNPEVDEHEIAQLTAGASDAIGNAVEAAQSGWDNFVSWLNSDDEIGNHVWTFSHDDLAAQAARDFSERWKHEGDWELFGRITATPICPGDAVAAILQALGLIDDQNLQESKEAAREFRRRHFAGKRNLGDWWRLAERNTAAIADVLRRHPEIARRAAQGGILGVVTASANPGGPIPDAVLRETTALLEAFAEKGTRRLRIDAKAALGVLPIRARVRAASRRATGRRAVRAARRAAHD